MCNTQYTYFFWGCTFSCDLFFFRFLYDGNFWRYSDTTQFASMMWMTLRFELEADWFHPWSVKPRSAFKPNPSTKTSYLFELLSSQEFFFYFVSKLCISTKRIYIYVYTFYTYMYYTYFASYFQDLGTRHFDIFSVRVVIHTIDRLATLTSYATLRSPGRTRYEIQAPRGWIETGSLT